MQFEYLPVLDRMIELYQIHDLQERFKQYLVILQDEDTSEMIFPIDGYNPMAKQHVLKVLTQLKDLNSEKIVKDVLAQFSQSKTDPKLHFKVSLNVADNLGGAWTNRYTTDYNNKFKSHSKRKRGFVTPVIWVDEIITEQLIVERTKTFAYRTIHQIKHGDPIKLDDHVNQETFVCSKSNNKSNKLNPKSFKLLDEFYQAHRSTENYNIIFNFFYGNKASHLMGYKKYGIIGANGFDYCEHLSTEDND